MDWQEPVAQGTLFDGLPRVVAPIMCEREGFSVTSQSPLVRELVLIEHWGLELEKLSVNENRS